MLQKPSHEGGSSKHSRICPPNGLIVRLTSEGERIGDACFLMLKRDEQNGMSMLDLQSLNPSSMLDGVTLDTHRGAKVTVRIQKPQASSSNYRLCWSQVRSYFTAIAAVSRLLSSPWLPQLALAVARSGVGHRR